MRGLLLGIFVFILGVLVQPVGERLLKDVPEWVWRWAAVGCVCLSVSIMVISDPFYGWLRDFRNHPVGSTFVVGISAFVVTAAAWIFLIIGYSSSPAYVAAQAFRASAKPETLLSSVQPSPANEKLHEQVTELTAKIEEQGKQIANWTTAMAQSPSLPFEAKHDALKKETERLSQRREELERQEKESHDKEFTFQTLEEGFSSKESTMSIHEHEKSFGDYVDSQRKQAAAFNEGKKEAVTRNTAVLQTASELLEKSRALIHKLAQYASLGFKYDVEFQGLVNAIERAELVLSEHDGQPESVTMESKP